MRVGLLTEGGYPYATGEARVWCDRLVRGLADHEFEVYALSRGERQEATGRLELPPQVRRVRTAPLWGTAEEWSPDGEPLHAGPRPGAHARSHARAYGRPYGRRERRRFARYFAELAAGVCGADGVDGASAPAAVGAPGGAGAKAPGRAGVAVESPSAEQADRFATGLYGLAELAQDCGGLSAALHSETALRTLEEACRAPGARRGAHDARLPDLLAVLEGLEHALRPLSLDWYGWYGGAGPDGEDDRGLGGVDLCHATSGGAAALPGLLAKRFFGVPLLVTEYSVRLREHYLAYSAAPLSTPVRSLLTSFQGQLAAEIYRHASLITPGNTHVRRWQEWCGAERARMRTVYSGMDASPFAAVGEAEPEAGSRESAERADDRTLVWVGRIEPAKDLVGLLHAFARVREAEPEARLRIVGAPGRGEDAAAYAAQCRVLAAQLFPDEAESAISVGDNPVSFERVGDPEVPELADAYASGAVVVLSSVLEGFPRSLVEAMLCGRPTVSTDVGAVCEVIGGTGLVVPPRNPRALADACVALLGDPDRRARLGAAARARALELFTVEQNIAAFGGIYLELMSHAPVHRDALDEGGEPLPFARPAEAHVPGRWAASTGPRPAWAGERGRGAGEGREKRESGLRDRRPPAGEGTTGIRARVRDLEPVGAGAVAAAVAGASYAPAGPYREAEA
ncbi:DUF3492 domain-containing protein [Streptomyces pathocidini]|uniref:DUF3492 domain-containing protein n=1 Tax=Streptomyces pathocidini TaxID=1650571 RepID=UPI00340AA276